MDDGAASSTAAIGVTRPRTRLIGMLLSALFLVILQTVVRRRRLRQLWAADTAFFAQGWAGKVVVTVVLLVIPIGILLQSFRMDRYANDSWIALLTGAVAGGYLVYVVSPSRLPSQC